MENVSFVFVFVCVCVRAWVFLFLFLQVHLFVRGKALKASKAMIDRLAEEASVSVHAPFLAAVTVWDHLLPWSSAARCCFVLCGYSTTGVCRHIKSIFLL